MLTGLARKELREIAWIAVAAIVVYFFFLVVATGIGLPERSPWNEARRLPFNTDVTMRFALVEACLAVGLGLRQTVGESARGTFQFLLNRPASRWTLVGTKLLIGGGIYLAVAVAPLLLYAWWAATPGTHASPFAWWMTVLAWRGWLAGSVLYLGAFLAGLRPGRWHGTRLLPLVAAAALAAFCTFVPWPLAVDVLLVLVLDALLVANIFFVARTRDFS
jgi:hypothetical protein